MKINIRKIVCFLSLILGVMLCLSQNVYAEDTNTDKDFNKKKSISISKKETYAASKKYVWIKYQATEDGYLTIEAKDTTKEGTGATGYIALYNSTKTSAYSSKNIYYNTNSSNAYWTKNVFGVMKDQTYYFRVKAETPVSLVRTFTKTNDKSGALRTSGYQIKKKKAVTGLLPAGSSTVDWYKISLTNDQKIRLYYTVKSYGKFRISIHTENQRLASYTTSYTAKQQKLTISRYKYSTGKKLPMQKGTYYIKVEKVNSQSSGYYKLKWK